jgi:UDP-2,4-diacetamido-2,4,6-trideoxy-beta-L-altropyranose hydrolase
LNSLLILTEGGENIGFGHITRCSAIYNYLKSIGWEISMFVHWNGDKFDFDNCERVKWRDDKDVFNKLDQKFDAVLVDSYLSPDTFFLMIKRYFKKLAVIDDYGRLNNYNANLIINPNIYGNQAISYKSRFIGGNNYVILRNSFQTESRKNSISKSVKRILITLGGTDIKLLLPQLANLLKNTLYECYFVCGNKQYANDLIKIFGNHNLFHFFDLVNQQQMIELMINAEITISGCGQTLNELAYLGTPTIGIKVGEDQTFNQDAFLQKGFLTKKITSDDLDLLDNVAITINTLLAYDKRIGLNKIGINLIDGKGVKRIERELSNV